MYAYKSKLKLLEGVVTQTLKVLQKCCNYLASATKQGFSIEPMALLPPSLYKATCWGVNAFSPTYRHHRWRHYGKGFTICTKIYM